MAVTEGSPTSLPTTAKVNFVGSFYPTWLTRGREFVRLAERMHPALEALDLPPRRIIRHVREMAKGKHSADRLLNALMAYLYWLDLYRKG